jgi:hypothetical protein
MREGDGMGWREEYWDEKGMEKKMDINKYM